MRITEGSGNQTTVLIMQLAFSLVFHYLSVPPTHTDSSVFIRISRGIYGHTDTTRHYTEARFRHQAQDMLLVDLVAVSVRPTETFL